MRNKRFFTDQYEGNPAPDFAAYAKAGHVLYAHKASEGVDHYDQRHRERVKLAHEHGLTVMHYHFCRPDQHDPLAEIRLFWTVVSPTYRRGDVLALDFERALPGRGAVPDRLYIEKMYLTLRGNTGHSAVIYGSTSFLETFTSLGWLRFKRRWQAQYGRNPGRAPWGTKWWAWQSTDGSVGPEPHKLDGMPVGDVSVLNLATCLRLSVRARGRRGRLQH